MTNTRFSHNAPSQWFAFFCLLLILGVGPVQAVAQEVVFENGFEFSSAPLSPDWQLLYGYDSGGNSWDQEGVIGVETDESGNVYSLVDRRYRDDRSSKYALLLTVDSAGALTNALRFYFSQPVSPVRFKRTRDGNFLLLVENDQLIKITPAGLLIWARTLKREPNVIGGLNIRALNDDSAGNIYFAGHFTPSGSARGFVAKLDSNGNGLWMRSWEHDYGYKETGLAVSDNGNSYVTDHVDPNSRSMVFGFATNGTAIGQASLLVGTSAAASVLVPTVEGSGVTIVGFQSTVMLGGALATRVYRTTLDSSLQLTANAVTQLETEDNLFPITRANAASRSANGSIRLGVGNDSGYGVVTLGAGGTSAFALEKADGTTPYIDDRSYQVHVASGPNNELYIGGTSEQPGTVQLVPIVSEIVEVALQVENPGYAINEETLVVVPEATTFTVASDSQGVINDPQDGDEDALFLRVTL